MGWVKIDWWELVLVLALCFVSWITLNLCLRVVSAEQRIELAEMQIHYFLPDLPENCRFCHFPTKGGTKWKIRRTEK